MHTHEFGNLSVFGYPELKYMPFTCPFEHMHLERIPNLRRERERRPEIGDKTILYRTGGMPIRISRTNKSHTHWSKIKPGKHQRKTKLSITGPLKVHLKCCTITVLTVKGHPACGRI